MIQNQHYVSIDQAYHTLKSAVFALKSLQKSMIFNPAWPSAGPTGGEGLACPALITNLIIEVTVFPDMIVDQAHP